MSFNVKNLPIPTPPVKKNHQCIKVKLFVMHNIIKY
jgi:hypothetical protein